MRELTVYYCSKCGQYGYYQLPKNAVCPNCHDTMISLPMSYQSFMNLEFDLRDRLIANQIASELIPHSSVVQRITELEKGCDSRFIVTELKSRILELEATSSDLTIENGKLRSKNEELNHTIDWMHALIWDLTKQLRVLKNQ